MRFLGVIIALLSINLTCVYAETNLKRYEAIAGQLKCVVCKGQSVLESEAHEAKEFQKIILEKIQNGETDDQIKSFFIERYGDNIVLKPQFDMYTILLWGFPVLIFFILVLIIL